MQQMKFIGYCVLINWESALSLMLSWRLIAAFSFHYILNSYADNLNYSPCIVTNSEGGFGYDNLLSSSFLGFNNVILKVPDRFRDFILQSKV